MSRRLYPEYKPSGVEWLGDIPASWEAKRVRTVLSRNDSGVWGEDFDDEGVIVLRSTEQTVDGDWKIVEPARRRLSAREHAAALLREGDLVLTKSSGSSLHIGKTSIVTREVAALNCCYSNFMQRLRVRPGIEARFMWYVLNGEIGRKQFDYLSSTTTGLANLNGEVIGNVTAVFPSPAEQRAIAAFLERETARIDALIEKKQRQIELLQEKRAALISHTVTKGLPAAAAAQAGLDPNVKMKDSGIEWLGQIPEHWDAIPVKRRYGIQLGKMLQNNPESDTDVSVPYAKALHVRWGKVDTSDLPDMWASPSEVKHFGVKSGDLLVCEGGEAGRAGIVDSAPAPCIIQNALHRVRGKGTDVRFLQYVLQTVGSGGWFDVLCNKATIAHFTREKLAELRVPMPVSLAEQLSIDAFLDRETARIDALIEKINSSINLLREYRTALISAAVTGKIDVREEVA